MPASRLLGESNFIFGLDPDNRLHDKIMELLRLREKIYFELALSSAAILEVASVLRSRNEEYRIRDFYLLLDQLKTKYGDIEIIPVTIREIDYALDLMQKYQPKYGKRVSYYDCVHIATAYINGYALIVRDNTMKAILEEEGMYYIDLDKSINEIYDDLLELSRLEQLPYGMLSSDI